jgi:hypothetical protein
MLKYILVVVFGRSSKFCGLPVYQRRGDLSCGQWRLLCFSPVIACLFFVAGVLSMLEIDNIDNTPATSLHSSVENDSLELTEYSGSTDNASHVNGKYSV